MWTELLADVSTPVGVFPRLAGDGPGILLESVERSERWGRYSFVAGDPAAVVIVDQDGLRVQDVARPMPTEPARRAIRAPTSEPSPSACAHLASRDSPRSPED